MTLQIYNMKNRKQFMIQKLIFTVLYKVNWVVHGHTVVQLL